MVLLLPQSPRMAVFLGRAEEKNKARLSEVPRAADAAPGTVQRVDEKGVHVACVDGVVLLGSIQLPGKKIVLAAKHWQSSLPIRQGALLV